MPLHIDPAWEYREVDPEIEEAMGCRERVSPFSGLYESGFRFGNGNPNRASFKLAPAKACVQREPSKQSLLLARREQNRESRAARREQNRESRAAQAARAALRVQQRESEAAGRALRRAARHVREIDRAVRAAYAPARLAERQERRARERYESRVTRQAMCKAARHVREIDRAIRAAYALPPQDRRKLAARKWRAANPGRIAALRKCSTRALRLGRGLPVRLPTVILLTCAECGLTFGADRKSRKCCSDFCRLAWLHKNRRPRAAPKEGP